MTSLRFTLSARRALALGLFVAVAAVVVVRHVHAAAPTGLPVAPLRASARAPVAGRAAQSVVVDVEGAVRRPGLVHLPPGSRVADAVARAGGATRHADRTAVNLAASVTDGQQVLVPTRGAPSAVGVSPGGAGGGAGTPLSLSTATPEQLDALPGVGPVTAQRIVDYRTQHGPFHAAEELDAIPGIGPARLADLKGLVVP